MDDHMGVLDFHPSTDVGVVYLTEADLVEGDSYKAKLYKLAKVLFWKDWQFGLIQYLDFSDFQLNTKSKNRFFPLFLLTQFHVT